MAIFIILIVFLFIVIFLFSSKKFSPIPYFPSQPVDLKKIIEALDLKNGQTVYDLGAGDGLVIFRAAHKSLEQKLDIKFVAVEINPVLVFILLLRRLFHPNKKRIKIVFGDMFKMEFPLQNNAVLYLYISPWFLEKTVERFKISHDKFRVVSYMYPIKSLKNKEKEIRGKNSVFVYDL